MPIPNCRQARLPMGAAIAALVIGLSAPPSGVALGQVWQGPQGGQGQGQGQGGAGKGQQGGHDEGGHEDGGQEDGGHEEGEGQKGGHQQGGAQNSMGGSGQGSGGQGGSPVWAQEGIPEVELGRLNVVRSPRSVLDRALEEALSRFDAATMAALYEMSAVEFAATAESQWGTITIIDSPLQNLALLRQLWTTGDSGLPGVDPRNPTELSAILLGVASDKSIPISTDTVRALATILRVTMSDATMSAIASRAETVRRGVLAGHG